MTDLTGRLLSKLVAENPPRAFNRPSRRSAIRFALPALLLCAVAWPSAASAQKAGEYGPHIAYSKAIDSDEGNYLVGGHMELFLAPFLGLRGAVDYRSSERFRAGAAEDGAVRVRSVPVTLSGRLYLPLLPSASPFLQAGAGWYRVTYDYSDAIQQTTGFRDQSVTTFGWHVGGGLKLGLSSRVSLSGEAQYVFVDPERRLGSEVRDQIRGLDYNSTTFGLGLGVSF